MPQARSAGKTECWCQAIPRRWTPPPPAGGSGHATFKGSVNGAGWGPQPRQQMGDGGWGRHNTRTGGTKTVSGGGGGAQ